MKRLSFISFVLSAFLLIGFVACEPINPEVPSVDSGGTSSDSTSVDNGSGGTDITNPNDDIVESGYVDLGLSVKWAATNVGADTPEGYGDFYTYDEAVSEFGNCMPTEEQFEELKDKCTWEWITRNEVNGWKVTGPNGKSIFLPAAGSRSCDGSVGDVGTRGFYWSSTPYEPDFAAFLYFDRVVVSMNTNYRCYGFSVRLVRN